MLKQEHLTIITVLIFIAPVAIFIPSLVGATQADTHTENAILTLNEKETLGQNLEVTATDIQSNSAEITVYDRANGGFESQSIAENESYTYQLNNGDVTVTLNEIQTNERIGVTVNYPAQFGWDSGERQVNDAMPPMIILPIVIIILSVLYAIIKAGSDS